MFKVYIDKLINYWVLIPVSYFGFGLLTISLYYSPYNINILNYLDFTELLSVWFFKSTFALFDLLLIIFLFWFLKMAGTMSRRDYHYFHLMSNFLPLAIWMLLILRYLVNVFHLPDDSIYLFRHSMNFWLPFTICTLYLINIIRVIVVTTINIYKEYVKKTEINHLKLNYYISIFLVVLFSVTIPTLEVQANDYHATDDITILYTKTDTISSDKDLVVVGQTRSFMFFYRKSNNSSKIVSLKDVTRIDNFPLSEAGKVQSKKK